MLRTWPGGWRARKRVFPQFSVPSGVNYDFHSPSAAQLVMGRPLAVGLRVPRSKAGGRCRPPPRPAAGRRHSRLLRPHRGHRAVRALRGPVARPRRPPGPGRRERTFLPLPHPRCERAYAQAPGRSAGCARRQCRRWPPGRGALLGRRGPYGHGGGRPPAPALRPERRRGPGPHRRGVEGDGEKPPRAPLARNRRAGHLRARIRARAGHRRVSDWPGQVSSRAWFARAPASRRCRVAGCPPRRWAQCSGACRTCSHWPASAEQCSRPSARSWF